MRINQYLAHANGLSRREADDYIARGMVIVNGETAKLGMQVENSDTIVVNGEETKSIVYKYVLFNKPVGYVTSRAKQSDEAIMYDLLPQKYHDLKSVGRLDKDSSGLLLLTNDGNYANEIAHPSRQKEKVYEVILDTPLKSVDLTALQSDGAHLEDGPSSFKIKTLDADKKIYQVRLTEGRNRQIRRSFEYFGYRVVGLKRTQFGPYSLSDLAPGKTKEIAKI